MLKVLIVDDELLARLALRTAIDWETHGFEVVAEAEDGLTGLLYVQQYKPDILLTDISMPGMNGVELVKKTKECSPDTEIIILSCHNDFDYVKEGMHFGASNYILKLSLSMEELLGELLQLKEKIRKKNLAVTDRSGASHKGEWPGLLFSLMAKEELSDLQLLEDGKRLGLIGSEAYVALAVISVDGKEEEFVRYHKEGMIENLAEAVMARYRIGIYVPIERNRGIILCQMNAEWEYSEKISALTTMLEELIGLIHDCYGIYASAGISTVYTVLQLKSCYRQAYNALMRRFYTGPGQIHMGETDTGNAPEEPGNCLKEVLKVISTRDLKAIREETMRWLDCVSEYRYPPAAAVKKQIHELLFQMDAGTDNPDFMEEAYHNIQKQTYLEEIQATLEGFFTIAEDCWDNGQSSKREIILAKKYVRLNYQDNIKVSDVAEYVNMNGDYFSHLFKKETGSTFSTYLNEFRLEKAKQLLMSGQYKVYEAAYAVGFQDENYFIRCFKKQMGRTPSEYMKA